jgi:hypothetical protein
MFLIIKNILTNNDKITKYETKRNYSARLCSCYEGKK